jgi:dipeptidyl aminopeptidase/acylaminoacyl peptidase
MTSEPILDRRLRERMAELAAPGDTSAAIDNVLSTTGRLRPEPRWLVLLKEPPMRTSSVLVAGSPPMRTGLVLALVALLVALAATVAVGALVLRPTPVAPAYGPAGNGQIALAVEGDILSISATGGSPTPITSGPDIDSLPSYSRDGSRIAFVRGTGGPSGSQRLMVANADGTGAVVASPELLEIQAFDWSPTGDRLAVLGDIRLGPAPSVFVAAADGSTWSELEIGSLAPSTFIAWRPPAGDELVFRAHPEVGDPAAALYAIAPDGGVVRPLMDPAEPESGDACAVCDVELAPDGQHATFWTWGPNQTGEVNAWGRVLDLASGDVRIATTWGGSSSPITPDGRSIVGVGSRLELEPIDGSAPSRTVGPEFDPAGVHIAISPDGSRVVITESSGDRTLVDIASGEATPLDARSEGHLSWQRLALP